MPRFPRRPLTIRFKLILAFMAVFGVLLFVMSIAGQILLERHLRNYFDDQLIARTREMVAALVQSEQTFSTEGLERVIAEESQSIYFRDFYVQARDDNGQLLAHSHKLKAYRLPFEPRWLSAARNVELLQTLDGPEVEDLVGVDQRMRMVVLRLNESGITPIYLQVATSLEEVDTAINLLHRLFWLGVPPALLAAGVTSWLVSEGFVRRLRQLSKQVQQLTPDSLGKRRLSPSASKDEVGLVIESVDRMLRRLEAGFDAQKRFVQDVSHELKTPLAILQSEAQVLQMGSYSEEEAHRFARSVSEEAAYLCHLVESLLALTLTDGKDIAANRQEIELNELTVSAVQQMMPLARQHAIALHLQLIDPVDGENEIRLLGDPQLFVAMISNLIRNAIRFAPADSAVRVGVERREKEVWISVRDYGPGIPADVIDRIFDRFQQFSPAESLRSTGLGLAIAKSIVELHGGRIIGENLADGDGCRFVLAFPLR